LAAGREWFLAVRTRPPRRERGMGRGRRVGGWERRGGKETGGGGARGRRGQRGQRRVHSPSHWAPAGGMGGADAAAPTLVGHEK
jgi:hypothetical protein